MKRVIFLLLLVLLASPVMMFANGEQEGISAADDGVIKIGISIGTLKQERWQREIEMFKAYGEANGIEILVQSAEDEAMKQMSQCENLLSQGVDVLIVQALDSEAMGSIVEPAHEMGVPVIAYDRLVRNGELDYYVTFDSVKVGRFRPSSSLSKLPKVTTSG